ncbi:hypothetical protein AGABI1DRAFT_132508 [Agaricus bisporus var. burnettii JB137-S8]|uniref:non-specific serine/threonine protein kinase n=1 Tax=Agaricus bisporus var. burnettii (strain JB137-S8 / ATCC MYA-4627 / FGSC 10392) TaxID=597362 RepID=K5WWI0_AGABU|nr:uncharacterized protein AGABI1DRAFT_132508 [Agaricus bisporus var. burnettii JB137-S8]EKM75153.1 hypothetical protein AGABI1DRAFT_132508 [Agaricus bisporus var. burnettii JB137-S8]
MSGRSKQASAPKVSPMKETLTWLSDTLRDREKRQAILRLRGPKAQSWIDLLSSVSNQSSERNLDLSPKSQSLSNPDFREFQCYILPVASYMTFKISLSRVEEAFVISIEDAIKDRLFALKVVRLYQKLKVEDLLKAHAREAILWSSLRHPNIVPFHGIYYFQSRQRICLVSPWMGNGDIVDYLERVPEAPRKPFIYDIANGLHYLHSQNIVHGDLKGRNVLNDDHRCACIADFGLSTIVTDETLGFVATTTGTSGHTTRWASPELLEDDARPTTASDIWAFGCVCYEGHLHMRDVRTSK